MCSYRERNLKIMLKKEPLLTEAATKENRVAVLKQLYIEIFTIICNGIQQGRCIFIDLLKLLECFADYLNFGGGE
jgi:hypothetical protein